MSLKHVIGFMRPIMSRTKTRPKPPKIVELNHQRLDELVQRAESHTFEEGDYETVQQLLQSYAYLTDVVGNKSTTIARLRALLFGTKTESRSKLTGEPHPPGALDPDHDPGKTSGASLPDAGAAGDSPAKPQRQRKGHGRISAEDYTGATTVRVDLSSLTVGAACPECQDGTLYKLDPGIVVRISGQAPLRATVYELEKIRCNLCGVTFTADAPAGIGEQKYDAASVAIIGVLKYGTGVPFNRVDNLQESVGVPVPASTQWDIVSGAAPIFQPAYDELIRQAAQGDIVYNDDTTVKILEYMGRRAAASSTTAVAVEVATEDDMNADDTVATEGAVATEGHATAEDAMTSDDSVAAELERVVPSDTTATASQPSDVNSDVSSDPSVSSKAKSGDRKGLFTSGVVATRDGRRIVLFFSGRQHAGENLADVLKHRSEELQPPIQMCDGLSRNYPAALQTILANCLVHARRKFVEVRDLFPDQCDQVIDFLANVYHVDDRARQLSLTPEQRLALHQRESQPVMAELKTWLESQFAERLVEPNSSLGGAIRYMLAHWDQLTLFLRQAGAPLDNNLCERVLKMVIVHRKNSLFYKTQRGARVGDMYMSLIHTCRQCGASPMDYLVQLQEHAEEVAQHPEQWMPWNYEQQLLEPQIVEGESVGDSIKRMRRHRRAELRRRAK
jgi:hypothetical protein